MTDQRPQDEIVTATYRDLAGERSPAHLDEKILRLAASRAEHRRYARSVGWTRPLAWAATIALCLAITLELTRVPAPEDIMSPPLATVAPPLDAMPAAAEAEPPAVMQPQPAGALLPEKQEAASEPTAAFSAESTSDARARSRQADNTVASGAAPKLRKDTNKPRQAADIASTAACPDEVRTDPETWLQCIEALEESGDSELAAQEREALIEVFPDFKLR